MITVLISLDLRVILNSMSGVKYHFVARFVIGKVYNKVKDNLILLKSTKLTSLGSFVSLKRKTVFDSN